MHQVQVDAEPASCASSARAPGRTRPRPPTTRIDPSAPERLARTGAERAGSARRARIDYLVLNGGKPLTWGAYFKGGEIVIGDAHGRPQRVL